MAKTARLIENAEKGVAWYLRGIDVNNDIPCIFSTWANHVRKADPFCRMNPDEFRDHKRRVMETLIVRAPVAVAHYPGHPDQILGWMCGDGVKNVLHFVFVKEPFRGNGIARSLVSSEFPWLGERVIYCTHKSLRFGTLSEEFDLVYDPYRISL